MNRIFLIVILILCFAICEAQEGFSINSNKNKITIPFKFINNLIFIPINVNGLELNFLLDTGVEETVLFGLEDSETSNFNNVEKIQLKGFGKEEYVDGLKSTNNKLHCKNFIDFDHELYIILDQNFNFSAQIGIPVNGIIGYKFFKNHLIETNYSNHKIIIYKENSKIRKKINLKFSTSDISIESNKPYLLTKINFENKEIETKMLIDSGSGDALWLFENQKNKIKIPNNNFDDYLGRGFSGELFGKRARIEKITINQFEFNNPLTSFPDSLAISYSRLAQDREGSIGGEILKRFDVIYDYPNQKIFFKKNSNFNLPFNFNMSGIEIEHDGLQWIAESSEYKTSQSTKISFSEVSPKINDIKYSFSLKPLFKISNLRKNSPAEICGLKKGDLILEINNNKVFNYTLQEINELLKSEEGKTINITINRNDIEYQFKFQLKSLL
jgi:PDZ domain